MLISRQHLIAFAHPKNGWLLGAALVHRFISRPRSAQTQESTSLRDRQPQEIVSLEMDLADRSTGHLSKSVCIATRPRLR